MLAMSLTAFSETSINTAQITLETWHNENFIASYSIPPASLTPGYSLV